MSKNKRMNRLLKLTILFVAVATMTMSCGQKKPAKINTVENLKSAIEGEIIASANYKAFSEKAEEEGFFNIAKMFAAASEAEAIHARSHNAVLVELGEEEFNPTPKYAPTVHTTYENLRNAIDGETEEFDNMYPKFIEDANTDNLLDVITTFKRAKGAEKTHARMYAQVLKILETTGSDETIASEWFVCPVCGNLFYNIEGLYQCPLCSTASTEFMRF